MKALTIYQPWASLIMAGAKPYEFRGWSPRRRGGAYAALIGQRIIIHASTRKMDRRELNYLAGVLQKREDPQYADLAAETCLIADKALPVLARALDIIPGNEGHGDLPWGVGLGTAVLGEPRNGFDIAAEFGLPRANDSDRDEHANFGWPLTDIEVWDMPVECRGFQGFWNWPTPEAVGL